MKEDKGIVDEVWFAAKNNAIIRHGSGHKLVSEAVGSFQDVLTDICGIGGEEIPESELLTQPFPQPETNQAFASICALLMKLEAVKGKHYRASWCKRGQIQGVKANLERKIDRIEAILESENPEAGESLVQTLGDAAVYIIKWINYRATVAPQEYKAWIHEIQKL